VDCHNGVCWGLIGDLPALLTGRYMLFAGICLFTDNLAPASASWICCLSLRLCYPQRRRWSWVNSFSPAVLCIPLSAQGLHCTRTDVLRAA
jgi:hypothetical protein